MVAGVERIEACFLALKEKGEAALIPFLTAGDPDLETTEALLLAMAQAGADIIELGIPFSDPTAEGPTIQRSSHRALLHGTNLRGILKLVGRVRAQVEQPLVLMGYANTIHAMGAENFARIAAEVGVDGVIIPDLTPEDGAVYLDPIREVGIAVILLAAPTTSEKRFKFLASETQGFLYYVSVQGVTGARAELAQGIKERVQLAQSLGESPVCVGFGVGTPEQAEVIGEFADGVVVGSAIVDRIEGAFQSEPDRTAAKGLAVDEVGRFIEALKKPLRR